MGILLAFAPFIIFAIVDRFAGSEIALVVGASVSAILLLRDLITPNRSPKILEIGTFLLFVVWSCTDGSPIQPGRLSAPAPSVSCIANFDPVKQAAILLELPSRSSCLIIIAPNKYQT